MCLKPDWWHNPDSTPEADERFMIELFGYSAHVFDWIDHERRVGELLIRKGRRRVRDNHRRVSRPPDGLRTPAEAAAKLGCSVKTLNGHVAARAVKYVIIGHGTKRPRKMFTDADLNQFITNQTREASPCPSAVTRARPTGNTTFKSEVIAFSARRRPPTGGKQKR